jgi:hypothetical protein
MLGWPVGATRLTLPSRALTWARSAGLTNSACRSRVNGSSPSFGFGLPGRRDRRVRPVVSPRRRGCAARQRDPAAGARAAGVAHGDVADHDPPLSLHRLRACVAPGHQPGRRADALIQPRRVSGPADTSHRAAPRYRARSGPGHRLPWSARRVGPARVSTMASIRAPRAVRSGLRNAAIAAGSRAIHREWPQASHSRRPSGSAQAVTGYGACLRHHRSHSRRFPACPPVTGVQRLRHAGTCRSRYGGVGMRARDHPRRACRMPVHPACLDHAP